MKQLKRITLALIVCAFCLALAAEAQTPVKVQRAELSIPFGVVKGKLVTAGDLLVFVDEEASDTSFAIEKSNIKTWAEQEGVVTIDLTKAVKGRSGEHTHLAFRLVEGATTDLAGWYKAAGAAPASGTQGEVAAQAARAASDKPGSRTYPARQKRFMTGSNNGKLVIDDKMIAYESLEDIKRSRQWELKDVKEIKQTGPYVLKITPFVGEDYTFELQGEGMPPADYKALTDRISAARLKK